jgi:pyrroloquinoline quinone (PQQ) biosynthesis protein C
VKQEEIENAEPLPSTRIAWLAWEALMSNRHWLEGNVGNTWSGASISTASTRPGMS